MKNVLRKALSFVVAICICVTYFPQIIGSFAIGTEPQLSKLCENIIELNGKEVKFDSDPSPSELRVNSRIKYSSAKNLSAVDVIELYVFAEDVDALNSCVTDTNKFGLFFSSNPVSETGNRAYADISAQIVENGWNKVTVSVSDFIGLSSTSLNWSSVRYIYLGFTNESATMPEKLKNKAVKYKNVCDLLVSPEVTDGDVVIYDEIILNTLGENSDSLVEDTAERFFDTFEAKDISKADIIKADFFIPDYANLMSFLNQKDIKLSFLSGNGVKYTKLANTFTLTQNVGWYSTLFSIDSMETNGDFDETAVTGIKFEFIGENGAVLGDAFSIKIAVSNIRGFEYKCPEIDNVYGKLADTLAIDKMVFATTKNYLGFENGKKGSFNALKDAKSIEFDLYVNDALNFRNAFLYDGENNDITASWNLKLSSGNKSLTFKNVEKQVIVNGWNHIILSIDDAENNGFDFDAKFENIDFEISGIEKSTVNLISGDIIVADNFTVTKGVAAKGENKFNKIATLSNGQSGLVKDKFDNSIISNIFESNDLTEAKYMEFDIYIQNYTAFKSEIAKKGINNISFVLSSESGSISSGILGFVSNEGWNHLIIPLSKMIKNANGSFDLTAVSKWSLEFVGTTNNETNFLNGQLISVSNIISVKVDNPKLPENSIIISENGKNGVYGDTYAEISDKSSIKLETPVDISSASSLEFDFYVEDYEAFKKMLDASSKPLYFVLGTSKDKNSNLALFEFTTQVTEEGWNHIELQTPSYINLDGAGSPNFDSVYYAYLTFTDEVSANAYFDLPFNIMNICVTLDPIDIVPEKTQYEIEISKQGFWKTWGNLYNYTADKLYTSISPLDLSKMAQIEFDIYIEDYEAYKSAIEGKALRLVLASGENRYKNRVAYDLGEHIKQEGWNHIVINLSAYYLKESTNFESIKWVGFAFWNGAGVENPIGSTSVRVVNIGANLAEYDYLPELPENVIAQLGVAQDDDMGSDSRGNTVGNYFHYTLDKIFREKLTPVDFSKSNIVEFDVYVSDYEKMLAADNDTTDGQKSKLSFVVSSTKPSLWTEYSKPRVYYSSEIDLAPYIKHSGWNHIKIGRSEFKTKNHGVDWSALTAFMVYYRNSSNLYPYKNQNSDLYIKVANIVNTGIVADIPVDKEAELQPDKNAVYISSVEGLSDENGVWNIDNPIISGDYKTAGKSSIQKRVNYNSSLSDTVMGFIFDSTVDVSDLQSIEFDLFVDLPQYLDKPNNKIEFIIGNNRLGKDDYYSFDVNLKNIKQGWNKVSLNIENSYKVGNPDLKKAKLVMIRFTKINLLASNFEEIVYGIDNLRYISKTGSTILKVEGWENNIDNDSGFENNDDSFVNEDDTSTNVSPEKVVVEKVVNKTGKTKINKTIERTIVADYLTAGIIIGIEALVIVAAVVVFLILYRKKTKKQK